MVRFFDILFSGLALLLLSPLLVPIVIILKCSGEGEVFFLQECIGKDGKLFKFATMLKDSPNIGSGEITVKNDPRVLPLGKFLRKSKINELPQLWNLFSGYMSVVGPRPIVADTYAHYPQEAKEILDSVRPGLTGLCSVIFRDEESLLEQRGGPVRFYTRNITPYKSALEVWSVGKKRSLCILN